MTTEPDITAFYDPRTSSVQYVVADPVARLCAIIDPVLDYDAAAGAFATHQASRILQFIGAQNYEIAWILDTHPHADHFSAATYLKDVTGAPIAIGARVVEVQKLWQDFYNLPDFPTDGSQWDHLFADGESFQIGNLTAHVHAAPGHTLASITYEVGDAAFIHDTLFMPDSGTARADFPGGDARALWRSIQQILTMPDQTRLFTGHDYQPGGRDPQWESTVAAQKAGNIHLVQYTTEDAFVAARHARDETLPVPKLLLPALQVNLNAGRLPAEEANGRRYLRIPVGLFPPFVGEGEGPTKADTPTLP